MNPSSGAPACDQPAKLRLTAQTTRQIRSRGASTAGVCITQFHDSSGLFSGLGYYRTIVERAVNRKDKTLRRTVVEIKKRQRAAAWLLLCYDKPIPVRLFDRINACDTCPGFNSIACGVAVVMASRAEEYLQRAKECDEKAQAADHNDISNDFRTLAEHWRVLANIAARQAQLVDPLVKHVYADRRPVGFRGRNPTRQ